MCFHGNRTLNISHGMTSFYAHKNICFSNIIALLFITLGYFIFLLYMLFSCHKNMIKLLKVLQWFGPNYLKYSLHLDENNHYCLVWYKKTQAIISHTCTVIIRLKPVLNHIKKLGWYYLCKKNKLILNLCKNDRFSQKSFTVISPWISLWLHTRRLLWTERFCETVNMGSIT